MKVHELITAERKNKKRIGRGIGSSHGKTSGRGTKGQNSRSGGGVRIGFEGGQNPLAQRLPKKRGFKASNSKHYQIVNIDQLSIMKTTMIDNTTLFKAGLIKNPSGLVKILGKGLLGQKVVIKTQAFSKSAKKKIEEVGGKIEITDFKINSTKTNQK